LGKVIGVPKAAIINAIIAQKLDYTQNVLDDLQNRGLIKTKFKSGTELKRFIENGDNAYDDLNREENKILLFKNYTENFLKKYSSKKSAEQY
ncbi:hypothetical protein, partial [Pseudomonas alvandae]|uniref:hypothetical protein n=1 Tax=Pseudomonas canavaninivorans TaxID=2842348 RepID=UPI002B1E0773